MPIDFKIPSLNGAKISVSGKHLYQAVVIKKTQRDEHVTKENIVLSLKNDFCHKVFNYLLMLLKYGYYCT